jgi:lipopolysaccharide/colanic/teichoic acid biosynthesis glycosyltransferase
MEKNKSSTSIYIMLKPAFDRFFGLLLIILLMPLIILIGALILFDSPGAIIFSQKRLTKGMKKFTFYKFRTMWADARRRYPDLYRYKYTAAEIKKMNFKIKNDPRLTDFGVWVRRTSLDELPNLINVIRGEMSLVGPRPEIPEMLPYYRKDQLGKFSVVPGMTGLAQVEGRGLLTFQETLKRDIEYVENQSLNLDLKILAKTIFTICLGKGAF